MIFNKFPTLETENLLLRKAVPEDIVLFNSFSDPYTSQYEFWQPHKTYEDTQKYLETVFIKYSNKQFTDWVIELKQSKSPIGMICFHDYFQYHARADVGFWISKRRRGNGYAGEAAKSVIEYGFETLGLERIQAYCSTENEASIRVLEKIGMKREAMLKKYVRLNIDTEKLSDVYLYVTFPKN